MLLAVPVSLLTRCHPLHRHADCPAVRVSYEFHVVSSSTSLHLTVLALGLTVYLILVVTVLLQPQSQLQSYRTYLDLLVTLQVQYMVLVSTHFNRSYLGVPSVWCLSSSYRSSPWSLLLAATSSSQLYLIIFCYVFTVSVVLMLHLIIHVRFLLTCPGFIYRYSYPLQWYLHSSQFNLNMLSSSTFYVISVSHSSKSLLFLELSSKLTCDFFLRRYPCC